MIEDLEGLCESPEPIYLYVGLGNAKEPWYAYDPDLDQQTPVSKPAVLGRLVGIKMQIREYKGDENMKVDFRMQSGARTWIIRSGAETTFTRGIIQGLQLVQDFSKPLKIYAQAGETTVMGDVYDEHNFRFAPVRDASVKLMPIIQEIQGKLGQTPQTMPEIKQEFEDFKNRRRG